MDNQFDIEMVIWHACDHEIICEGDRQRLLQDLSELQANAIAYSELAKLAAFPDLRRKAALWDAICEKYSKLAEHNAPQPLATKMGLYSQRLVREYLGV